MNKPIQTNELLGRLAGKSFPPQKYLTDAQIDARIKFLEQQKRDLLGIVTRSYNSQIRQLAHQREEKAQEQLLSSSAQAERLKGE